MGNNKKQNSDANLQEKITDVIDSLCTPDSFKGVYHRSNHNSPMPSIEMMGDIVEMIRTVLFPGYFGNSEVRPETMRFYLGATVDRIFRLLSEQIKRGFCFFCTDNEDKGCVQCEVKGRDITILFIESLPEIRRLVATDVQAAYEGDPAVINYGETIFSYPSIKAVTNQRIAHVLYQNKVPMIPRIITEMAHSDTGIDIHPGAHIGEYFFIDHGTGVVIGETAVIGNNVRLYQGVTLGAKSFPLDKEGNPIKGIPRHPLVEDNVIIYSGATILGRVKIGHGSVIGGNVWLTHDILPGTRVMQGKAEELYFENGSGI